MLRKPAVNITKQTTSLNPPGKRDRKRKAKEHLAKILKVKVNRWNTAGEKARK